MTNWPVLDVAIGLSFTFAVLALVCTSINETIATIFNLRAKTLERWLGSALANPVEVESLRGDVERALKRTVPDTARKDVAKVVASVLCETQATPMKIRKEVEAKLISTDLGSKFEFAAKERRKRLHRKVARKASRVMHKASQDARKEAVDTFFERPEMSLQVKQPKWFANVGSRQGRRPSYISAATFATAVMQTGGNLPAPIRAVIEGFAPELRDDTGALRTRLEAWFDDSMQRVSGWYKRRVQLILACIGLVVAVGLNADALQITNSLWSDSTLRAAVVANAGRAVQQGTSVPSSTLIEDLKNVHALDIPFGWFRPGAATPSKAPDGVRLWISKIIGILITTFALMLGAPFWFDVLGRCMQIRNSGDTPSPSTHTTRGRSNDG